MARKADKSYREYETQLNRMIQQGDFSPVTLFCGEQDYLRMHNAKRLQEAVLGDGDPMNSAVLCGASVTAAQVIGLAQTLPFFSQKRVIRIEETAFFTGGGEETERLSAFMDRIPDTTCLIFVEPSPNVSGRLYKAIDRNGFICRCDTPEEGQLRAWAAGLFREADLQIDTGALRLFLEYTGTDMLRIREEADKLTGYCLERGKVTAGDIKMLCTPVVKDRIFDMISAVSGGRRQEAVAIYMDLQRLQTPPQVILSLMMRQYLQLLQAGELLQSMSEKETAAALKMSPWVLSNRVRPALCGCTRTGLEKVLEACVRADQQYKSGKIAPDIVVEELIVMLCGLRSHDSSHNNVTAGAEPAAAGR